jgi:hypothetical protein
MQTTAEAAKSTADSVASEFAGLKVESTKALKDIRQQVGFRVKDLGQGFRVMGLGAGRDEAGSRN